MFIFFIPLGFDQPNYDPVPYLCASILLVLHEELMNCQTLKAAETALLRGCKGIDESRLAQAMSEYGFEKTLGENLSALQEVRKWKLYLCLWFIYLKPTPKFYSLQLFFI